MSKLSYTYITYINSSPEKVWEALTESEMTRQYWVNHRSVSDWQVGSAWRQEDFDDSSQVDIIGTVLAVKKPELLALSWTSPAEADRAEKLSKVSFSIEPSVGCARLTVLHEDLDEEMLKGVSSGWPAVLSSLKTLLETGAALELTAGNSKKVRETLAN